MNTLLEVMKNDKTPLLRNLIVLSIVLSPDSIKGICLLASKVTSLKMYAILQNSIKRLRDVLSHDITRDLLRTKPDPAVEQRHEQGDMQYR